MKLLGMGLSPQAAASMDQS
jgi:hypothetical protein